MKVALSIPHTEKIEKFMFAKKVIRQKENGEFQPIHRAGLLNLADYEIVEQYNAEARGLCNYYNLACDYHTLDYFCYLMEYSCLKTIANKHKTSIRKIIRQYKDGKTWSVPYENFSIFSVWGIDKATFMCRVRDFLHVPFFIL